MICKRASASDYEEISRWWVSHGWTAIPLELLPMGWIVEIDGVKKCAGFLYVDGATSVSYLEYVVSNPDNKPIESYRCIDFLLKEICTYARYSIIPVMFCRIATGSLERLYQKHGFTPGDNLKDMICIL